MQGHCWVEGDNPECSSDSRSKFGPVSTPLQSFQVQRCDDPIMDLLISGITSSYVVVSIVLIHHGCIGFRYHIKVCGGQVPVALIEGRVQYIFWPPSRAGRVDSHVPAGRLLVKNDHAYNDSSQFGAFEGSSCQP